MRGRGARQILLRNGGLGPAVSLSGTITWQRPGSSEAVTALWESGSLGPGEERWFRLADHEIEWHNARGKLAYTDVHRTQWETTFGCQTEERVIVIRVTDVGRAD